MTNGPGKFQANTIADDNPAIKGASLAIWCDKADVCDEDTITEDIANEMRALATKAWNTKSNSIISHNQFKANYAKLGHVAKDLIRVLLYQILDQSYQLIL